MSDLEPIQLNTIDLGSLGNKVNNNESEIKIKLNTDDLVPKQSSNFGPGIELLMNDKKKSGQSTSENDTSINLDDLECLESDLNNLTDTIPNLDSNSNSNSNIRESRSLLFSEPTKLSNSNNDDNIKLNIDTSLNKDSAPIKLNLKNEETVNDKTWDGYQKFNDIPINPDKNISLTPQLSKEELLREKFKYLRMLEDLERKGIELSKKYTMESSLLEMQGEYETIKSEKEKKNSVKFQGRMLMAAVTGLEFLNNKFDPFDFKLDGWSEQVNENIDDYDEIFAELHEKYQSKAKMAPELKLLFQLTGSAIMLHMTNTMFKSAMPGMDDIMRQNPELMEQFTKAAVNQMGQNNPGLGNFMNGMMNEQNARGGPPASSYRQENRSQHTPMNMGPPPEPMKTKNPGRLDNYATRPDIGFGRGHPEPGLSVQDQFDTPVNLERSQRPKRAEMKGPSDISDLLSGIKTKTVTAPAVNMNIKEQMSKGTKRSPSSSPKRSKRKPASEKNTISLDI